MQQSAKKEKFEKVYKKWVQPLFRYVFYKTGDRLLSEDIVQEVFVKYWEKMYTIDSEKPYLYTSVNNFLKNKYAHDKVVLKFEKQIQFSNPSSPHFDLEVSEFKVRLENEISALPEKQREVFLLHKMDGYKYREIADLLNISQKAVEKRMSLALSELRKIYKKI